MDNEYLQVLTDAMFDRYRKCYQNMLDAKKHGYSYLLKYWRELADKTEKAMRYFLGDFVTDKAIHYITEKAGEIDVL